MANKKLKINGTLLLNSDAKGLNRAAALIRGGGIVAFPTETVYGLGASALDVTALEKIFKAKGRPSDNPLIVHIAAFSQLEQVAVDVPERAEKLAEYFWPGPLSLVLPKSRAIPDLVSGGLATVAVRMPDHPVALELIRRAGVPLAAPSANRSGRPSPTSYQHVLEDLTGRIDAVLKARSCKIGVESTVLDLTGSVPVILRPGGISREALEEALGCRLLVAGTGLDTERPSSPGMKYRHYSPRAPLLLITGTLEQRHRLMEELGAYYRSRGFKIGTIFAAAAGAGSSLDIQQRYAARLYRVLRRMDTEGVDLIVAEATEKEGLGLAVMNRLFKAAVRVLKVF